MKYNPFVTFFLSSPVLSFFSSSNAHGPACSARQIFTLHGLNDVVQPKDGPFGLRMMSDVIWRKCATKTRQNSLTTCFHFCSISRSRVQILLEATLHNNLGQVVYTYVPLSPSSTTWYRPKGGDAVRLGR